MFGIYFCFSCPYDDREKDEFIQGDTKKTGTFEKPQQKLKKSKKKKLLTEIEPLQLAF